MLLNLFQKTAIFPTEDPRYFRFRDIDFEWRKRSGVKSIQLKIYEDGKVCLLTNKRPGKFFVSDFFEKNYEWLCLQKQRAEEKIAIAKESGLLLSFLQGSKLPFLGKAFSLDFLDVKSLKIEASSGRILIPKILENNKTELRKRIQRLYKKEATTYISQIQTQVSSEMNLHPLEISFRSFRSRWGSCSSQKKIQYNWKLIAAPREHIRYVVVHETAHLQHMNHSKEFWALVGLHCGEYTKSSEWLKNKHLYFEFLNSNSEIYK